jgi:hypothetical protein
VLEDEKERKLEEERLALEEVERLIVEETTLRPWKMEYEEKLTTQLNFMNEKEDWEKYSNCKEGYINIRKEKELNGFIYEFKERCDSVTINILIFILIF